MPRAPQIAIRPASPCASLWLRSLPDASSSKNGVETPPALGSMPEHELGVHEAPAAVVQLHRVDHVALGIVHPRGDEDSSKPSALRSPTLGPHGQ